MAGGKLVAVECSLSPLTIWLRWGQAVSGGSGFARSSGSGFAGRGESSFAGSKLVVVDWVLLVGEYYMISCENNQSVKYPMLVIIMAVMVMVVMVMVVMVMVVEMTIEKRG